MVTQKAISARINKSLLEELDLECSICGLPRNMLINLALRRYLDHLDRSRNKRDKLANL